MRRCAAVVGGGARLVVAAIAAAALPGVAAEPLSVPSTVPVLVGAGDIGDCTPPSVATGKLVAGLLDRWPRARAFTLGDNAYGTGTSAEFAGCYHPAWGSFRGRTIPVAGNHDWMTPGARGFIEYFGLKGPHPTWTSLDVGSWHVVVLDTDCAEVGGCSADSPQGRWLAEDLARSTGACTLALWHHPRFSSGAHGSDVRSEQLWKILEADGAELVLSGHDHHYERFDAMTHDGKTSPGGLVSVVAGTGGGRFYPVSPSRESGSRVAHAAVAGVVVLALEPKQARLWFLDVAGAVRDSAVVPCR